MNAIHYIGFDVHKKNYQFLRKDGRRPDCGGRHTRSGTYGVAALGGSSETWLAWCDGSDAVQCVDFHRGSSAQAAQQNRWRKQDDGGGLMEVRSVSRGNATIALGSFPSVLLSVKLARQTLK